MSRRDQLIGGAREIGDASAGAVFQIEVEAAGGAEADNGRQSESEREAILQAEEALLSIAEHVLQFGGGRLALVPGFESGEAGGDVGVPGRGGEVESAERSDGFNSGRRFQDVVYLQSGAVGTVDGGTIRQAKGREEYALVFIGQEAARQLLKQPA